MIYLSAAGQILKTVGSPHIVADTVNHLVFSVRLSGEWRDLHCFARFTSPDGELHVREVDNGIIGRDAALNLSAGAWKLMLIGDQYVNGELKERITTNEITLTVKPSGIDGQVWDIDIDAGTQIIAKAYEQADRARSEADRAAGYADTAAEKVERAEELIGDTSDLIAKVVEDSKIALNAAKEVPAAVQSARDAANSALTAKNHADVSAANAEESARTANAAADRANNAAVSAGNASAQAVQQANIAREAANAANSAASLANTAKNAANTAADKANASAQKADTATANANTAAGNANTAGGAANEAATNATQAAASAREAAQDASDAADLAREEAGKAAESVAGFEGRLTDCENVNVQQSQNIVELMSNNIAILQDSTMWRKGTLGADGSIVSTTIRIITNDLFSSDENIEVTCAEGFRFCIGKYYEDGTYIAKTGYSDSQTLYRGYKYRIEVKLHPNDASTISTEDCKSIHVLTPFIANNSDNLVENIMLSLRRDGAIRLLSMPNQWKRCTIASNGQTVNSTSRLTSDGYLFAYNGIKVSCANQYIFRFAAYDYVDGQYVIDRQGVRGFTNEITLLEKGKYYKIEIQKVNNTSFEEISDAIDAVDIIEYINTELPTIGENSAWE